MVLLLAPGIIFLGSLPFRSGRAELKSAHRMIFWANCREVAKLSDRQLDEWKTRGIDGFVCAHHHLEGFGGVQQFDRRRDADLLGDAYELQRSLRDSRIVLRAKDKGMKMYLGFYLANSGNNSTPLLDWFDDTGWKQQVLPRIRDITGAAKALGFDGISFDQELYGRAEAANIWPWDYPGNTRPEAHVRAKVKQRGQEVMGAALGVFPRLELLTYAYTFEDDWKSIVQERYNNIEDFGTSSTFIDWYDGLSSREGYSAIRLFNSVFYKSHSPARDWETALAHEYNAIYSLFSRRLSNWSYAASRIHLSPAIWIDDGAGATPDGYDSARPPNYVDAQLLAMRKWAAGGELVIFAYHGLYGTSAGKYEDAFNYRPYVPAIQRASTPTVVDRESPSLSFTSPTSGSEFHTTGREINLRGAADDNMALRAVRWKNDRGGGGAARMHWQIGCGDHRAGYQSKVNWTIGNVPLRPGTNTIAVTAEDIKGLKVTEHLTIIAASSTSTADSTDPTVHLTSPSCNAVVTDRVMVTAEALDNVAVAKVEFLLDGAVAGTVIEPPYSWEWDALSTGEGVKTLTAKAYDTRGRTTKESISVTVRLPPSQFTINRTTSSPAIDGILTEYASAKAAVFGRPNTASDVTARALWDAQNLYLAYAVKDNDIKASNVARDGNVWEDDSVEWFVDVKGDGGGSGRPSSAHMMTDDYQGVVSVANVQYDARGSSAGTPDPSWNGVWTSHVKQGSLSASGSDEGYVVEIAIPWATLGLGGSPEENTIIGLSFAVNDMDASGGTSVMWPDIITAFQNASKWQRVKIVGP